MINHTPIRRRPDPSEEGYILVAVIFMLAILILTMTLAAPAVKKQIQRDQEVELMHRGQQYTRAIKLYYKKFHAYPPNIDALVKTNEIRFLRKKYIDLTTGKEDWKPIRFGQAKTQTLGFFGQPLAGSGTAGGSVLAGTGPNGNNGITGTSPFGNGSGSSLGGNTTFGATSDPGTLSTAPTSATGSPTDGSTGGTDPSGSSATGNGPGTGTGTGLGGQTGQTFGGAGIIGFSPNSPKQSILIYKKKNHYNEWEFVYDPLADQAMQGGNAGTIGQPAGATGIGTGVTSTPTSSNPPASQPTAPVTQDPTAPPQ